MNPIETRSQMSSGVIVGMLAGVILLTGAILVIVIVIMIRKQQLQRQTS